MRILENELKNRTIDYEDLQKYGFIKENEKLVYKSKIYNNQFEAIVEVEKDQMGARLIDLASEEEYVLVDIPDSTGEFVGNIPIDAKRVVLYSILVFIISAIVAFLLSLAFFYFGGN